MGVIIRLWGEIGAKWVKWASVASIATFDPALLITSRILVHFLVELTYGSFWEILSYPSHSVGNLWEL